MNGHHGLTRSRAPADTDRPGNVPLHEGALLGVEEELPLLEAEVLDGFAQMLVILRPGEGRARRGCSQARQERLVLALLLAVHLRGCLEAVVRAHLLHARPRGQGQERLPVPGHWGGGSQIE